MTSMTACCVYSSFIWLISLLFISAIFRGEVARCCLQHFSRGTRLSTASEALTRTCLSCSFRATASPSWAVCPSLAGCGAHPGGSPSFGVAGSQVRQADSLGPYDDAKADVQCCAACPCNALKTVILCMLQPPVNVSQSCGRRSVIRLEAIARDGDGSRLTPFDRQALALTHGFAHGVMHSLFFTVRYPCTACVP